MKRKRLTAMLLAFCTLTMLMGGTAIAENAVSADETAQSSVTGRVTAVSESSITMELGTLTANTTTPGRQNNQQGEPGQAPCQNQNADASPSATVQSQDKAADATTPDTAATPDNATAPDAATAPDNATDPGNNAVSGSANINGQDNIMLQNGASSFTANGETLTFAIDDSTTITLNGRTGSISSITIGSILTVTLSGETATTIAVTRRAYMNRTRRFGHKNGRRGMGGQNIQGNMPNMGGQNMQDNMPNMNGQNLPNNSTPNIGG